MSRIKSQDAQAWQAHRANNVITPTLSAPAGAARFDRFLRASEKLFPRLSDRHSLLLCILLYEGTQSEDELASLLRAMKTPIHISDGCFVQWTSNDGKRQSRALDPRTLIALSRLSITDNVADELGSFKLIVQAYYPECQRWTSKEIWRNIFHDALAWLSHHLPLVVFSMHVEQVPTTSLAREILIRKNLPSTRSQELSAADEDAAMGVAYDMPMEALFEDNETKNKRARFIHELQGLFSDKGRNTDIRLSDKHWRVNLHARLSIVSDLVATEGTGCDSILLLWVQHLLSVGSLRLSNPTVSTISRYFNALASLISNEYSRCETSAVHMDDQNWHTFFTCLKNGINNDLQRPALASFHDFCTVTFGAPAAADLLFPNNSQQTNVHANTIWNTEIDQALKLAATVNDDTRICASAQALIAIGAIFPIRIGEVRALRLEDFRKLSEGLELRFSPRRFQHQGKSQSAKRLMHTNEARWLPYITDWLKRRIDEEQDAHGKTALLFGDPHRPTYTYQFSMCSRLVNRILKEVTGDESVSFHTLRHAWVNRSILECFAEDGEHQAPSRLHAIAAQVGHADIRTTLEHYFHRPDQALRVALNNYWRTQKLSSNVVGYWTGSTSTQLRKAKQRDLQSSSFYLTCLEKQALNNTSASHCPKDVGTDHFIVNDLPKSKPPTIKQVSKILEDLSNGLPLITISIRCSCTAQLVDKVIDQAVAVLNDLLSIQGHRRSCISVEKVTSDLKIAWISNRTRFLKIRPSLKAEPSTTSLVENQFKNQRPTGLQRDAVRSWVHCKADSGISIPENLDATPMLEWLLSGGVKPNCLLLRIPAKSFTSPHDHALALSSESTLSAVQQLREKFGSFFRTEMVKLRAVHQAPYLLLAPTPLPQVSQVISPAQLRMNRLHGLLFSLAVWIKFFPEVSHEHL
jgi:Phage integrase family